MPLSANPIPSIVPPSQYAVPYDAAMFLRERADADGDGRLQQRQRAARPRRRESVVRRRP
jgi:hypothetical protein